MAKRITDEVIEQINELYLQVGVKKRVAEALGISPSTVSKYIIKNYKAKETRTVVEFTKKPAGEAALIERIKERINDTEYNISAAAAFAEDCVLSEEEWAELRELQKEIMI